MKRYRKASVTRDVEYNSFIFRHMFVMHCKKYTLCNKKINASN